MRYALVLGVASLCVAATVSAQAVASGSQDGFTLINDVAKKYSDATAYYIEEERETLLTTAYSRNWSKAVFTAAEASGNRLYFEGRSENGESLEVADGKTVWTYRASEHRYMVKPQSVDSSGQSKNHSMSEMAMMEAKRLKHDLGALAKGLKSAQRLPDETLTINGRQIPCEVVRITDSDEERVNPDYIFEKTLWIDKADETVAKVITHAHTYLQSGGAKIPLEQEITTTYVATELGTAGSREAGHRDLFAFTPPPDAKVVQEFPDPTKHFGGTDLTGSQIPALKLKSADGSIVSIESFRGKPVLIDVWATWCGPCVAAMPKLAQLNEEAKGKGLVLLAVDEDEEAGAAADFLKKNGYSWRDFHDGDGEIQKLVGSSPIPRVILVDAQGRVTFDGVGTSEDELRTQIAKLGPEYSSLAPKAKPNPCVVARGAAD